MTAATVPDTRALADLTRFAQIETASRDVEPWADLLAELHLAGHLDPEAAIWLLTLYNTYDDLGSAWSVYRRWPAPAAWANAPDRNEAASYPLTGERRNLRGGLVLRRLASYYNEVSSGGTQTAWLARPLTGDDPARDFDRLTTHLRTIWGVGRLSAFEWAEFLAKVAGFPVAAGHGHLWDSSGPRASLERLYGNTRPSRDWLDARARDAIQLLADAGVHAGVVDVETLVCDFNVMRGGRYYPGRHLAALREEITRMPPADQPRVLSAWHAIIPPPWNAIAPGISKPLLGVYRDTGRIIDQP